MLLEEQLALHGFSPTSKLFARSELCHAVLKYDRDQEGCITELIMRMSEQGQQEAFSGLLMESLELFILFCDIKTCHEGGGQLNDEEQKAILDHVFA